MEMANNLGLPWIIFRGKRNIEGCLRPGVVFYTRLHCAVIELW